MPTKYQILLDYAHYLNPKDGLEEKIYELEEFLTNDIEVLKKNKKRIKQLKEVVKDLENNNH